MEAMRAEMRAEITALHSTHDFARSASHVYGKTSTAARLAGAASDEQLEAELLDTMLAAADPHTPQPKSA